MSDLRIRKPLSVSLLVVFAGCLLSFMAYSFAVENETGAAVFKKRCVMCHAEDGKGDTKAGKMMQTPDITATEWKNGKTAADLVKTLREGLGKMPKFEGKLSDDELNAVSEYTIEKFVQ